MLSLFAPLLAQLVTVSVSDRTEARLVVADDPVYGKSHYEAGTYPAVSLGVAKERLILSLSYTPANYRRALGIEAEEHAGLALGLVGWKLRLAPHELVHRPIGDLWRAELPRAGHRGRRGTAACLEYSDPTLGGTARRRPLLAGLRHSPEALAVCKARATVRSLPTVHSMAAFGFSVTPRMRALLHRVFCGAQLVRVSRLQLRRIENVGCASSHTHRLESERELLGSGTVRRKPTPLAGHYRCSEPLRRMGISPTCRPLTGVWNHRFNVRTATQVSAGLNGARNSRDDGYVAYSIYPSFFTGITNVTRLSPGSLVLSAGGRIRTRPSTSTR